LPTGSRKMASFTVPDLEPECPVHLTKDLSKDQLLSFRPFRDWLSTLKESLATQAIKDHTFHDAPYKLRKIDIQAVDFFGGERIGFIKVKADVSNDNGEKLPGSVFLRGGSVGMMVCFTSFPEP
jgi:ADP-sugar diphosphatase